MTTLLKIITQILIGANIVTIVVMMIMGYADRFNPEMHPLLTNLGLFLPAMLIINMAFLVLWIFVHIRYVWIPFVGFILCYQPIRNYFPINLKKDVPDNAIKVLSYNVWYFGGGNNDDKHNNVVSYIAHQKADIVCLQEAQAYGNLQKNVDSVLNAIYPYHTESYAKDASDRMILYSKYRIMKQEPIVYQSEGNHSTAFYLNMKDDTVIVIGNHLESIGLTDKDKEEFKHILKGCANKQETKEGSKSVLLKLARASKIRAPQAQAVARFIAEHQSKSVIVCGDFNDTPNSYVRRAIAKNLIDCYIETGNGPGISYHKGGFYVRIDHIMCSKDWKPYNCKVDSKIKSSDHYPIYCWLQKKEK